MVEVHMKTILGSFALVLGFAAAGCGSTADSPTAPTDTTATTAVVATPAATTFSLTDALVDAIQDEYHAEAVYQGVIADFGSVWPFANIIRAEQNHAAALGRLFTARGLAVPVRAWTIDNAPRFSSLQAACGAAADAEVANVAVYDRYLGEALPDDVRLVFTNNRAASLNNHLPAFNRCK
jgi:hypothetical protein